ncbi:hypothetical protein F2Q70_00014946 [Brassica cretica]|uniref:Wax synthase domain-containing protein n=1 Tax=Brassica cretica TaxID=69181 RepID=A0A8S9I422_BRACR|nr:hypothetical protein F2Q70_00014946 [Brassica cretica]
MDGEVIGFVIVWILAVISVSYCYYISSRIKAGVLRLISVVPVCGSSASLACPSRLNKTLILKIKSPNGLFPIKVAIFAVVLHMYDYKQYMSPVILLVLYVLHVYLELDIALMLVKLFVFITLGCDLEPQADEPYLATSLQDFWGRRWNLMVPAILRPAIYIPVRQFCRGLMSSDWATFLAVLATFVASGVAHEVFFFALTFEMPTGEVACFFVLHGVCTTVEVAMKRTEFVRRWRVSPTVSRLLTVGFVVVTSGWLLFPTLARSDMLEKLANEALLSIDFVKRTFYSFWW